MDLDAAEAMARDLMARHGLRGWTFAWDRAVRRAGATHFGDRRITLSRQLTALHDEAGVRDTVLHEIAHALVGPRHGHDAVWRRRALAIGASGRRCLDADAPTVEGRWRGVCPAGHETTRHRAPTRVVSCRACSRSFDLRFVYAWTLDGEPATMPPAYARELARLRRAASDPGGPARGSGSAGRAARTGAASRGSATGGPHPGGAASGPPLRPGDAVRITASGRYGGRRGVIVARRRTRYAVDLGDVRVSVPFDLVERVR